MDENTTNPSIRSPRWTRILLFVSLALNLLIIGAVGSAMLSHGPWKHRHPPGLDHAGGPMTRALSEDDRRAIGRKLREAYKDRRSSRQAQRQEFEALIAALQAQPFDPVEVETRMQTMWGTMQERFQVGQSLLLEHLTEMSDADRALYAERLMKVLQRRR